MPIYEYVCPSCHEKFEMLRPFSQADAGAACPVCHARAERKLSAFASFSRGEGGVSTSVAGGGGSCGSCSSGSCGTCGH